MGVCASVWVLLNVKKIDKAIIKTRLGNESWSVRKRLNSLPNDKVLDVTNLNAFADDKLIYLNDDLSL